MSSAVQRYNADVIKTECPKCGAGAGNYDRCYTIQGFAHAARLAAAGYQWCNSRTIDNEGRPGEVHGLERLNDPGKCELYHGRKPGTKNKQPRKKKVA